MRDYGGEEILHRLTGWGVNSALNLRVRFAAGFGQRGCIPAALSSPARCHSYDCRHRSPRRSPANNDTLISQVNNPSGAVLAKG